MLIIRLSPAGKRGQKYFRLIVSEKTKDVFGHYLEQLGNYNPHKNPPEINLKTDRIKYWLERGAQTSPTIHNLLVDQKIIQEPKVTSWKPKSAKDGSAPDGKKAEEKQGEDKKPEEKKPEEKILASEKKEETKKEEPLKSEITETKPEKAPEKKAES